MMLGRIAITAMTTMPMSIYMSMPARDQGIMARGVIARLITTTGITTVISTLGTTHGMILGTTVGMASDGAGVIMVTTTHGDIATMADTAVATTMVTTMATMTDTMAGIMEVTPTLTLSLVAITRLMGVRQDLRATIVTAAHTESL